MFLTTRMFWVPLMLPSESTNRNKIMGSFAKRRCCYSENLEQPDMS